MAICSVVILLMTFLSVTGFFEFGTSYTYFVIIVGLLVSLSPKILSRFLSDNIMKYYMFISASVFIGVMGANGHIGIYICTGSNRELSVFQRIYRIECISDLLYGDARFGICKSGWSARSIVRGVYKKSSFSVLCCGLYI